MEHLPRCIKHTGGALLSHSQGTTTHATIKRPLDIVLQERGETVIREPLTELDNGDEPDSHRELVADMDESCLFVLCRFFSVGGGSFRVVDSDADILFVAGPNGRLTGKKSAIQLMESVKNKRTHEVFRLPFRADEKFACRAHEGKKKSSLRLPTSGHDRYIWGDPTGSLKSRRVGLARRDHRGRSSEKKRSFNVKMTAAPCLPHRTSHP